MTEVLDLLAHLVLPDGRRWGEVAASWQWADATAILDLDSTTPYSFCTRPRGGSKTTDAGALALVAMVTQLPSGSRSYGLASDRDQGRLIIDSVAGFVRDTPSITRDFEIGTWRVTHLPSGSTFDVLSADASGSWGLRPSFVIIDELAQWAETSGPKTLWEAVVTSAAKDSSARLMCITSAGDPAHFSHRILEHAKGDRLWRVSEVPGPVPWLDPERIGEQKRRLSESSYRRLFLNEWVASEDRLTSLDDLRACVTLDGPQEPRMDRSYVVSLDLGITRDAAVACVAHREMLPQRPEDDSLSPDTARPVKVVLDRIEVWQGSKTNPVRLQDVEQWLLQASQSFRASRFVLDPWQAVGLAQRLRERGLTVEEFTFSQTSVGRMASTMHLALRNRQLALPPDEELIDELANVRLRQTSPGVYRMDHDPDRHDDRAVALAMAVHHLIESAPRQLVAVTPVELLRQNPWRDDLGRDGETMMPRAKVMMPGGQIV